MKLGILITTNKHLDKVIGIAKAADSKGHEVEIFSMDEGVRFLSLPEFTSLCELDNIVMSLCNHSASEQGVATSDASKEIILGSQLNNAMMNNASDKIIVL